MDSSGSILRLRGSGGSWVLTGRDIPEVKTFKPSLEVGVVNLGGRYVMKFKIGILRRVKP